MWEECSIRGPIAIQEERWNGLDSGEARPVVVDTFLKLFRGNSRSSSRVRCGPNVER